MKTTLRSIAVFATSLAASGAVVLAACGFPSPVLSDDLEPSATDSGGGARDATVSIDASAQPVRDAQVNNAVSERIDAAGCTTCDCDHDGYPNRKKPGCEDAGPADAGDDCEDEYPAVHPGQTEFSQEEGPPHGGDRNCDGVVEKLYTDVNVKCPSFLDPKCSATKGYTRDPACGEAAPYVKCVLGFLECPIVEEEILYPPQGCR